jgi:hypothetical protein
MKIAGTTWMTYFMVILVLAWLVFRASLADDYEDEGNRD